MAKKKKKPSRLSDNRHNKIFLKTYHFLALFNHFQMLCIPRTFGFMAYNTTRRNGNIFVGLFMHPGAHFWYRSLWCVLSAPHVDVSNAWNVCCISYTSFYSVEIFTVLDVGKFLLLSRTSTSAPIFFSFHCFSLSLCKWAAQDSTAMSKYLEGMFYSYYCGSTYFWIFFCFFDVSKITQFFCTAIS